MRLGSLVMIFRDIGALKQYRQEPAPRCQKLGDGSKGHDLQRTVKIF